MLWLEKKAERDANFRELQLEEQRKDREMQREERKEQLDLQQKQLQMQLENQQQQQIAGDLPNERRSQTKRYPVGESGAMLPREILKIWLSETAYSPGNFNDSLKLPDECGTCTIRNSSVALNDGYS